MYNAWHTLGFFGSVAASTTDAQLPAVAEAQYNIQSSNFQIPEKTMVVGAYASGLGILRARINVASQIQRGLPQIEPPQKTLLPGNLPAFQDLSEQPIDLRALEQLRVDTTTDATAGPNNNYAVLHLATQPLNYNINGQKPRWVRATASVTIVQGVWCAPVSLVFQDNLESSVYTIYGMSTFVVGGVAARLILQNQWNRPGCICTQNTAQRFETRQYNQIAAMGIFNTYTLPQIEVLGDTAATVTAEVHLLIGQTGQYQGQQVAAY